MLTLSNKLKAVNLKVTPQRLAIYEFLMNTTSHPNAENVYNGLKNKFPNMSFATVYKTLDSLSKANLIQEINVGESYNRYDATTDFHLHIICNKCKKVYDYMGHNNLFESLRPDIQDNLGFKYESAQAFIYAICPNCV